MPIYTYTAKQGPDRVVEGDMEADSEAAVLARLDGMGCSPLRVREKRAARSGRLHWPGRIRPRDITLFARQLAGLLRAGVPMLRALTVAGDQAENARLRPSIRALAAAIRDGKSFSEACAGFPSLFPPLFVSMARAGESAGALDHVLARLADEREKDEDTRRTVRTALAYPTLILLVGVATVFVLLVFFLPRITSLFDGFHSLPLPTRLLIAITDFASAYWAWALAPVALAGAILARLAALEKGRLFLDRLRLRIPGIRRFILEADLTRCARTLAMLLEAGIPVGQALLLAGETLTNTALREELDRVRVGITQQGRTLADGLGSTRFFPALAVSMTGVGEESGRLEETLRELADYYEKEIAVRGKRVAALLEPALILAVGGIVGFIVAAMLLPIFEIGTGL